MAHSDDKQNNIEHRAMTTHEKATFLATYAWAKSWADLPWAHQEPSLFLAEICRRRKPGKALDIGCGAGTDSIFLAQQGWDVSSLDFMPRALEYTQQRAAEAGVAVTPIEADITDWIPSQKYDLVLDHGLLHNMDPLRHPAYRKCVLQALAANGELVLLHWHPLYPGQPNGKLGPTRRNREEIKAFFAPELQERFFACEEFEDLTSMVGGGMVQAYYWLRPNQAYLRSGDLLAQIKATLHRHAVDFEKLLKAAGSEKLKTGVSDELLAIILGPGRLGLHHVQPEPAEIASIIAGLAARAGESTVYVENLLRIFADPGLANICIANARCDICEVHFCKRLRYR